MFPETAVLKPESLFHTIPTQSNTEWLQEDKKDNGVQKCT